MKATVATTPRTSVARVKKEKEVVNSLRELVRQAILAADGRWEGAEARIVEALRDPAVWTSLQEESLPILAHTLVTRDAYAYRRAALAATTSAPAPTEATARLLVVARATLMNYPLEGGLLLGNARRADLEHAAEVRETQATANQRSARWLRAIAERLRGAQQVKSVLVEGDLYLLAASTESA